MRKVRVPFHECNRALKAIVVQRFGTARNLAKLHGIPAPSISNLITGRREVSPAMTRRILTALQCKPEMVG